jgi:hypothetical protein
MAAKRVVYGYPVNEGEIYVRDMSQKDVSICVNDMIANKISSEDIVQFVLTWSDMKRAG